MCIFNFGRQSLDFARRTEKTGCGNTRNLPSGLQGGRLFICRYLKLKDQAAHLLTRGVCEKRVLTFPPRLHSQVGFIEGFIVIQDHCFALISMTRNPKHRVPGSNKTELGDSHNLAQVWQALKKQMFHYLKWCGFPGATLSPADRVIFFPSTLETQVKLCFIFYYNKHSLL